jgi:DNA-nicking Smr family endonuclease
MSRDRRRVLSYEERVLWTTVTKSMTPLSDASSVAQDAAVATSDAVPLRKPPGPLPKKTKAQTPPPAVHYTQLLQPSPPPGLTPLSRRMKRSVARGKERIDARLDLHGLTQHEAHDTLLRFLRSASARDARLVLVITGKGKRIDGYGERERGVLRRQVPQWLSMPEFRAFVLGFEDAHVAHGGDGALYVRMRRAR